MQVLGTLFGEALGYLGFFGRQIGGCVVVPFLSAFGDTLIHFVHGLLHGRRVGNQGGFQQSHATLEVGTLQRAQLTQCDRAVFIHGLQTRIGLRQPEQPDGAQRNQQYGHDRNHDGKTRRNF